MNKVRINLWNREFELVVSFSCYPGECITDMQKDAIMDFCKHTTGIEDALDELKNYVEKTLDSAVRAVEIDNIFKYIMPKSIFVPRTEQKEVAIICNYKYDMEHGIAIVFENERLKEIGMQDIIL